VRRLRILLRFRPCVNTLQVRLVTIALAAAHELSHLNLADALALLHGLRVDHGYPKAAARWPAGFVMEAAVRFGRQPP
jgi:hypothetical protein